MSGEWRDSVMGAVTSVVWGALGALLIVWGYMHFVYSPPPRIATIDLQQLIRTKVAALAKENQTSDGGIAQATLTQSAVFAHLLERRTQRIARKYNLVVLPVQAVVGGPHIDLTAAVMQQMGLHHEDINLEKGK